MRLYLKWALRSLLVTVAGLLLLLTVIVLTLGTKTGTRWAIDRVDKQIAGEITIEEFDGTLWHGLNIEELLYRDGGQIVRARNLIIEISWPAIIGGRIILDNLDAQSVIYRSLTPLDPNPKPFNMALSPLPLSTGVNKASVDQFVIEGGGEDSEILNINVDQLSLSNNRFSIRSMSAEALRMSISVSDLDATISGDVPVSANINWSLADSGWSGRGSIDGSLAELTVDQSVSGPYPATISGTIALLNQYEPLFDIAVHWQQWTYDKIGAEDGEIRLLGTSNAYDADYNLTLQIPGMTQSQLRGSARGDTSSLSYVEAQLSNQAGTAQAIGKLAWLPTFNTEFQVDLTDVDPSAIHGKVFGDLDASGEIAIDSDGNIRVTNAQVSGIANNLPIDIRGNFTNLQDDFRCDDCVMAAGTNRIAVSGEYVDDRLDLGVTISAPALDELWPGLAGVLNGHGRLVGSIDDPEFLGEMSGQQLRIAEWSADLVTIDSRDSGADKLNLSAELQAVFRGDLNLGSVKATAIGSKNQFGVELDWQFADIDMSAAMSISRTDDQISGAFTRATIVDSNTGEWNLSNPFNFSVHGDEFVAGEHEWQGPHGNLIISRLSRSDGELKVIAKFADVPLQAMNPFLPPNFDLQGAANADVNISLISGIWSGTINWSQIDSVLRVSELDDEFVDIRIPGLLIDVAFENGGAMANARIELEAGVSGELELALAQIGPDAPVTADFRMRGEDWRWVSAVMPTIDDFQGLVAADIHATGTLMSPEFSGNLTWKNGSLVIPALNVPIDHAELVISAASDGKATINGSATAGEGSLTVVGQIDELMSSSRSVELKLAGQTAELINWPEYQLWVSPDVVIGGDENGWNINGDVVVPRAEIMVRELPVEAVSLSADVVVIGEEAAPDNAVSYSAETRLELGDQVHVNAFGLDTGLSGELLVRAEKNRPLGAEGRVTLHDGEFAAYGQKLKIQQGSLTFTGPLDDPIVDVRAVRVIESLDGTVTAGLHLKGRAQNLTSSIYTEPPMAEAEALSYLVLGRPLSQATDAESGDLSTAAISLGLRQASRITEQLGQSFGLDQLSLTGDGGDSTALVAGKQLNSRVYARYAYGVFNRLGSMLLRYRISKRLSLEADAGETQSVDILYTVEKQ